MTSLAKPEIHNISLRRQSRTEPRLSVTYTKNFVKIGRVVPEARLWTDKQTQRHTDRHAHHNTPLPYRGRSENQQDTRMQHSTSKSVFSFLRQLTTWHCPHLLLLSAGQQSIDISCSPDPQQQTRSIGERRDRQTDGRTPYRYIDPIPHITTRAVPKSALKRKNLTR